MCLAKCAWPNLRGETCFGKRASGNVLGETCVAQWGGSFHVRNQRKPEAFLPRSHGRSIGYLWKRLCFILARAIFLWPRAIFTVSLGHRPRKTKATNRGWLKDIFNKRPQKCWVSLASSQNGWIHSTPRAMPYVTVKRGRWPNVRGQMSVAKICLANELAAMGPMCRCFHVANLSRQRSDFHPEPVCSLLGSVLVI